ncbi:MAG TPA: Nif3-like dinuclear metal center hexameric protein [Chitinophagales bacterium]|nr:Nif3-like dinuclear metal center hexameric protein [Chitinophagales bacterium]HMU98470.1 Nif3-like dinuclear metal center hexameric protein [Chitinophagales bacterium]HMV02547.1 Nif3-like dinuclear metal center hexameric protein [Chitinophagales bacterium]HMW95076.1 Nif3-like dinuclear metal center hexameric protein [Chitinophagales bacterium]HMY42510.1 Nif3-like dinuclear metal center hexameric protein [Chitinophagales bacterium]
MKIADIIACIEDFAPKSYQESYDNAGLIIGNAKNECTGVLICLDSIESVIDEAIAKNMNLVVAHHPIIFSGIKQIVGKNYIERIIIKAIKNDIAIYAAHTNLDNMQNGVNARIGEKLGIKNSKILQPKSKVLKKLYTYIPTTHTQNVAQKLFEAGAGNIGNYSECSFTINGKGTFLPNENANPTLGKKLERHTQNEDKLEVLFPFHLEQKILNTLFQNHPYEEVAYEIITIDNKNQTIGSGMIGELDKPMNETDFLYFVKQQLNTKCIRYTALQNKPIQKVAWCGGAGNFLLGDAIAHQADVFISGDFTYHKFFDADNQIIIMDIGHYESEQFTSEIFLDILTKKFRNFAIQISENNTNPINYI